MASYKMRLLTGFFIFQSAFITFVIFRASIPHLRIMQNVLQPIFQTSDTNRQAKNSTKQIDERRLTSQVTSHPVKHDVYPYRWYNTSCRRGTETLRKIPLTADDAKKVLEWYKSIDEYFLPNRTDPINMPEDEGTNLFINYDYNKPSTHTLVDSQDKYFHFEGDKILCYKRGTADMQKKPNGTVCICRPDFTGEYCSVPNTVQESQKKLKRKYTFIPRKVPRRIIFAMTFNTEHIVLFLKMIQSAPAIDLFLILEGNITNYGDPKPLYLLPSLKRGFMRRWHNKIMHMFTNEFVPQARIKGKGFAQEHHIRGLFGPAIKKRIKNIKDDDLFIYFDADETPGLDELLFLKMHDGYPFPVGFHMALFRYGLYWWDQKVKWRSVGVAPVKMFFDVYAGHAGPLRTHMKDPPKHSLNNYGKDPLHEVWLLGSEANCAGWHMTFFGSPGQVYMKIMSVINADWPRWADNSVNRNITYISTLFQRGRFFDLKYDFKYVCPRDFPQFKHLEYMFKYPNYFNYLLVNPNLFIP